VTEHRDEEVLSSSLRQLCSDRNLVGSDNPIYPGNSKVTSINLDRLHLQINAADRLSCLDQEHLTIYYFIDS
jgi:hypothetical protein